MRLETLKHCLFCLHERCWWAYFNSSTHRAESSTFTCWSTTISLILTSCASHSFWKHVRSDLQDIYTKLNIHFFSFNFLEICSDWLWPLVRSSVSTRLSAEGEMTCTKPQYLWCCQYPVWISLLRCAEKTLKWNGCSANLHTSNKCCCIFCWVFFCFFL